MRPIDADVLEKEGWSLHRTIRVDKNTAEYQTMPLANVPDIYVGECEDTISRQAAIEDLHTKDPSAIWDTADVEVWVNALPTIQPQRKRGKWETITAETFDENDRRWSVCSNCGSEPPKHENGLEWLSNYCPPCGAIMEVTD